jgi:hypothetical protein
LKKGRFVLGGHKKAPSPESIIRIRGYGFRVSRPAAARPE